MNSIYRGMTVNERLYVSGLMEDFDKAAKEKNKKRLQKFLKKIEITYKYGINSILKEIGLIE